MESKFAPSYGPVTEKKMFQALLEDYLEDDGYCSLPHETSPWTFWKAETVEQLRSDQGTLIKTLHRNDKESLFELLDWVQGACTTIRICVDY